jgi:uncharacterized protein YigA (DUF484 family)
MKATMKEEDVAEFLQNTPAFFETYAQMLSEVTIPHPYGGRTISLSERQMISLRERVKELESKLRDLIQLANENDTIQSKLHLFTVALFNAHDLLSLQNTTVKNLRSIFDVPNAAIHLWKEIPPSVEVLAFSDQQTQPVCLHHAVFDTAFWFGESASHLRSFAYMPLRSNNQTIGLLIIASEDEKRFYPGMGTVFLQRISEVVSAALVQHL